MDTKKTYRVHNRDIVQRLKRKYGVTSHYIFESIRGKRQSETCQKIRSDYKRAEELIRKTLERL